MDTSNWPEKTIVIGHLADGTPVATQVRSIFGGEK